MFVNKLASVPVPASRLLCLYTKPESTEQTRGRHDYLRFVPLNLFKSLIFAH